jgi:hypothetical protein
MSGNFMIIFEAPHFKLYWHADSPQYVQTEWHGFVGQERIEKGLTRVLEWVKQKHVTLWLSDLGTCMSFQRVVSNCDLYALQFDFFDTIEAAEEWLRQ